jgi:hypothetical protein
VDERERESRSEPLSAPPNYPFPTDTEKLLPWTHAAERLMAARNYWLATVRPDGRPHVTPLWGAWVGGALYVDGVPETRWARNIAVNPEASIHLENGDDVVILEGVVDDVTTSAQVAASIIAAWDDKYGELHPEPATRGVFRFRPRRGRGWSVSSLVDGTRWTFPPD